MKTLIIKKENYPSWLSLKMIKEYRFDFVAYIVKKWYEFKKYEVEELDNSVNDYMEEK